MLKIVGAVFDVKAKAWTFEAKAKDKAIKIILCLPVWPGGGITKSSL